jgi:O-antigen ligase
MDRQQLDQWCRWAIMVVVLAILLYSPLAFGAVRLSEFVLVLWLTVVALLLWWGRFWLNPEHRLFWPPMNWAILAFMGYGVVRYATAEVEYVARQELLRVLVYGALYFVVLHNLYRQRLNRVVSLAVVFLGLGLAMMAFYQFVTGADHIWSASKPLIYRKRGSATFINPNHLAGYLEMVLPLALAYTLTSRFKPLAKVLIGYAALGIFVGLVATVSRGGWIAAGMSLALLVGWLVRQRGYRLQGLLIAAVLVCMAGLFVWKGRFSPGRSEALEAAAWAEDLRWKIWKPAWAMWREHPWLGLGPGHFDVHYFKYRPAEFDLQFRPIRVHNDYLNTLVDWGLVGGGLMLAVWVLFFTDLARSWRYVQRAPSDLGAKQSNRTALVIGGTLGLVAILIHSWSDFNMHIPANALLATTLLALISSHFRFATERYWRPVGWALRGLLTVVLWVGAGFLGLHAFQATWETRWLARADRAGTIQGRLAALRQAHAIEPRNPRTAYEVGEILRELSFQGQSGYRWLAEAAIEWYRRSLAANPHDPLPHVGMGRCLDWLGRHTEAEEAFKAALKVDPNGYYTVAYMGWHHVQVGDYAQAKQWLERSLRLYPRDNPVAANYLRIIEERTQNQSHPQ